MRETIDFTPLPILVELKMGETIIAIDCDGEGCPIFSADKSVKPWNFSTKVKVKNKRGAIVIGARGSIGNPRLPDFDEFGSTQTTIVATPKNSELNSEFLYYALNNVDFSSITAQQAVPMLTVSDLKKILVPKLKPSIQEKIAEILKTIDQAINKTETLIEKYEQIKTGLMHDLFTRGIGPDSKLRPTREQAPELYQQTPIGWIPKDWSCITIPEICYPVTKGTTPSSFDESLSIDAIPYLRVENLRFDGKLEFDEYKLFVSKLIHDKELARSKVFQNDILMNIVGPPLGKLSLVNDQFKEWNTNQAIAIFRVRLDENREFLLHYLLSEFSKKWFLVRSKQTSGQVNLTLEMCNKLELPMPTNREEKLSINNKLQSIFNAIELENKNLNKLKQQKYGLMQDLLTSKVQVSVNTAEATHV